MEPKVNEYDMLVSLYGQERVDRQIELEIEGQQLGRESYLKNIERKRLANDGANAGAAKGFVQTALPMMVAGLNEWFHSVNNGKPGKRHKAASVIKDVDVDTIAYLTLKTVLDNVIMHYSVSVTDVSNSIGKSIEEEIRFSKVLATLDKKELNNVKDGLDKRIGLSFKAAYLRAVESNLSEDGRIGKWKSWTHMEQVNVGLKLLEIMALSTGMVHLRMERTGDCEQDQRYVVSIDQRVIDTIDAKDMALAEVISKHLPMVIPPKPWTGVYSGGYYMEVKRPLKFIRVEPKVLREVYSDVNMPNVYAAVNAIQETAWHINSDVMAIANEIVGWKNIPEGLDVPARESDDKPIRKFEAEDDIEVHKAWKREMVRFYQKDNKRKSRRIRLESILGLASKYIDEPEVYFPHNLDFRSRVYPVTVLSPQGDDFMKGILHFADGIPLGEHGAYWLAVHGANCYGLDKAKMEERVKWVYDNTDYIVSIAKNPLDDLSWCDVDSPWQFLAFCFEWAGYQVFGDAFMSRIAVAFDGSCSGIQHFSAMLRDEIGGKAVNLVPSESVQDIYGMVASSVKLMAEHDAINGTEPGIREKEVNGKSITIHDKGTKALAAEWLAYGIDRKVTKRSVMTLAYGSKEYGFADQVFEDTVDPANEKTPGSFEKPGQASRYMAKLIWQSVQVVVVKAVEAMTWLQTAAGLLASDTDINGNAVPVNWITPVGFPVRQNYRKTEIKQVDTVLNGKCFDKFELEEKDGMRRVKLNVRTGDVGLDSYKQRNGISPNFVHSMDASHLMLTVLECHSKGIRSFAMIHDSYGTHAGQAQTMFKSVREVFVRTYSENNVLQDMHDHVMNMLSPEQADKLPPIPTFGNLDLNCVKKSLYAFA